MERGPDIYLSVLKSSIGLILEHHRDLFDEKAVLHLQSFLNLDDKALTLLCRTLPRKYSWLRIDSFQSYLPAETDLEDALNSLITAKVFELFREDSCILFDELWSACSCLNVDELKIFACQITNSSNTGQKRSSLQQLKKVVLTQRSLFSSKSLVERFPKILNDVLASSRLARKLSASKCDPNSNVEAQKSERSSGRDLHLNISADARKRNRTNEKAITSKSSEEVAATGSKSNSCRITIDNLFVVRIVPSLLHLLRRVQRFEQISSPTSSTQGNSRSVYSPVNFNAPLMVAFKKVKYPAYNIFKSISVPLFTTRSFELWEASCELTHSFDMAEHADHLMERVRSGRMEGQSIDPIEARLSSVVTELQQIVSDAASNYTHHVSINNSILHQDYGNGNVSNGCRYQPADLCASLIQSSINDVIPFRLVLCLCAAVCLDSYTSEAEAEAIMGRLAVSPACTETDAQGEVAIEVEAKLDEAAAQHNQNKSHSRKRKSPIVDNSAIRCGEAVAFIDDKCRGTASSSTANVGRNNASHENTHGHDEVTVTWKCRPDFFVQLDPGASLANLVNEGANLFEKMVPQGHYSAANEMYSLLLQGPFLPHRRGRWYERLRINFAHLKLLEESQAAVDRGLQDPFVTMGDRLNLERQRQKGKAKSVIYQEQVAVSPISSDSTALMQLIQHYIAQRSNEVFAVAASIFTCPPQQIRDASCSAHTLVATTETCDKAGVKAIVGSNAAENSMSRAIVEACKTQIMDLTASDDDDDDDDDDNINGLKDNPSTSHSHMQGRGGSGKESTKGSAEKASTVTSESVRGAAKEAAQALDDVTAFWTCSTCTCVNPALVKFCEACLQPLSKNSTAVTATAGKGKRRQSVKNGKSIRTELKTESKKEGAARSTIKTTNKMKTSEEVKSLNDIDLYNGVIHCLDSDSDGDADDNGDGHCQILHDETRKNAGAVSGRGLRKSIGLTQTQTQTEQGNREGSDEGAFLLPEPLPLLLYPNNPTTASEPSHATSPDTLLDANSGLLVDFVSDDRSNDPSVNHSTRSISERFAAFGYDYPSTRLDLSDLALLKLGGPDSTVRARMPGTDSLYSLSSTSERSRSCDEAAACISDDQFHWMWDPDCCVVFGKRYGDPKRKGKSKFCGRDDELVTVETFVRQKCHIVEPDDTDSFCAAVDGGGWQGWHCEGSVLRTLFGLLMWDQMFSDHPDVFLTPYQDAPLDLNFPNFVRTRLDDITQRVNWLEQQRPDALIRAVGDSYRAHYRHKCRGVNWMHKLHTLQLIAVCLGGHGVAGVCRALAVNYKKFSSGTPDLLLIRVSRPRECSSTLKKTAGAVDDLAVAEQGDRGRDRDRDRGRDRDRDRGKDRDRDSDRDRDRGKGKDRKGPPECLDITDILGYDWDVLIDAGDDSNEGQEGSTKSLDEGTKDQDDREGDADASIQNSAPSVAPFRDDSSSVKTKGRYNKWRKRKTQDADNDDLQSLGRTKREVADAGQLSAKASMKVPAVSIFHTLKKRHTESQVVVDISDDADIDNDTDADADEGLLSESRSVLLQQVNNVSSGEDVLHDHTLGEEEIACVDADSDPATEQAVQDRAPSLDRFVSTLADLILPLSDVSSSSQHTSQREGSVEDGSHPRHLPQSGSEQAVSGQVCSRGSAHEGWKYECMMVEVKGPTDSLADHQLMWLCVLSSSSVATFVAHVKETSLIE